MEITLEMQRKRKHTKKRKHFNKFLGVVKWVEQVEKLLSLEVGESAQQNPFPAFDFRVIRY